MLNILLEASPKRDGIPTTIRMSGRAAGSSGVQVDGAEWLPVITAYPEFSYNITTGNGELSPMAISLGGIEFNIGRRHGNQDWAQLNWVGAPYSLWIGEVGKPFSSYRQLPPGTLSGLARQGTTAKLALRTLEGQLDVELLSARYAGTGGPEGPQGKRGVLKPRCGVALNVEPVEVDPVLLVYQVHGYGPVEAITAVYEFAQALAPAKADVATWAQLASYVLKPGEWITCHALGMFRLGGRPDKKLTADVLGGAVGGLAPRDVAGIIRQLLGEAGVGAARIGDMSALDFAWSFYAREQVTIAEVVKAAALDAGGYLFPDCQGVWRCGRLYADKPPIELRTNRTSEPLVDQIDELNVTDPTWRVEVGFDRCWSVHGTTDVSPKLLELEGTIVAQGEAFTELAELAEQAAADASFSRVEIEAMLADGELGRSDKRRVVDRLEAEQIIRDRLAGVYATYGVDALWATYEAAWNGLRAYILGLVPSVYDATANTPADRATYLGRWNTYEAAKANLLNGITGHLSDDIEVVRQSLDAVTSNSVLDMGEKPARIIAREALQSDHDALQARYVALGSPSDITAARDASAAKLAALNGYLGSLIPAWNDATKNTPIDPATFQSRWIEAHQAVAVFRAAITGRKGDKGDGGLVAYLTNENHTVAADVNGYVANLSGATGFFKVLLGTQDVTSASSFAEVGNAGASVGTIGPDGYYEVDALASDVGTVTMRATYQGTSVDKTMTVSKSRAGATGSDGQPGAASKLLYLSSTHQTFSYDGAGNILPQNTIFEATTQNADAEGAPEWRIMTVDGVMMADWRSIPALEATGFCFAWSARSIAINQNHFAFIRTNFGQTNGIIVEARLPVSTAISDRISVVRVQAGAKGDRGETGLRGDTGLPGATGAKGETSYVHYAYANSDDGRANFAVGAPEGRTHVGTYTDFSATDSPDPARYRWSRYAGPASFGLAGTGEIVIAQNRVTKVGLTTDWDTQAYSTEGHRGGAQVTFRGTNHFGHAMAGLNSDPATNASYTSLDYAWYLIGGEAGSNNCQVVVNGTGIPAYGGTWDTPNTFQVFYDNRRVSWLKDGTLVHQIDAPAGQTLYFDSTILQPNVGIKDIAFGAVGSAGEDGAPGNQGIPGARGADGITLYDWHAYADSPDGAVNFTTGTPGTRAYEGVARGRATAAESTASSDYEWREYRGPPFGIATRGHTVNSGSSIIKRPGTGDAFDSDAYSTVGYRGGAALSFVVPGPGTYFSLGFNDDPLGNTGTGGLDYAWHVTPSYNGNDLQIFENNHNDYRGSYGQVTGPVRLAITYDNQKVRYFRDGALVREVAAPADLMLYLDSSFGVAGSRVDEVTFTAAGRAGVDGQDALVGYLTNEAYLVPCDSAGNPLTLAGGAGEFKVFLGTQDVTAQCSFAEVGNGGASVAPMTASGAYQLDGVASDVGTVTLRATYQGRAIEKLFTATKSRAAVNGSNGAPGAPAKLLVLTSSHQTFSYDGAGAILPQTTTLAASGQNATEHPQWQVRASSGGVIHSWRDAGSLQLAGGVSSAFDPWNVTINQNTFAELLAGHGTSGLIFEVRLPSDPAVADRISIVKIAAGAKGDQGAQGPQGSQGVPGAAGTPGAPGANGATTYVHFAYANSANGQADFTTGDAAGRYYVGTYTDFSAPDSTNPASYTWSLFRGADGANGTPGAPGANGQATYVHIAYSNSPSGYADFSTTDGANRSYIGTLTDQTLADSGDPAAYTWSLIKGADGVSPVAFFHNPSAIQLQGDVNGRPAAGTLPVYVSNGATRNGAGVTVSSVAIVTTQGCTASVAGTSISVDSVAASSASVTYDVIAGGQTARNSVSIITNKAPTLLAQQAVNITAGITSTVWADWGGYIQLEAPASGRIESTVTATFYSSGNGFALARTKLKYRATGGAWTDILASEADGQPSFRFRGTDNEPPENEPGYLYSHGVADGLMAGSFYEFRAQAYRYSNATYTAALSGLGATLSATQVA